MRGAWSRDESRCRIRFVKGTWRRQRKENEEEKAVKEEEEEEVGVA